MEDPVTCSDGITYERKEIEKWLIQNKHSPINNKIINPNTLKSITELRNEI